MVRKWFADRAMFAARSRYSSPAAASGTDEGRFETFRPLDDKLCVFYHEQHRIGERAFQIKYSIDLVGLAQLFAERSPHRKRL